MKAKAYDAHTLRENTVETLRADLLVLIKEQFVLKMLLGSDGLSQNHKISVNKKSIARVKTIITVQERKLVA